MQAVPVDIDIDKICKDIESMENVEKVRHIHVWQLDDSEVYLETSVNLKTMEQFQDLKPIKDLLAAQYGIHHSTIEVVVGNTLQMENCFELE